MSGGRRRIPANRLNPQIAAQRQARLEQLREEAVREELARTTVQRELQAQGRRRAIGAQLERNAGQTYTEEDLMQSFGIPDSRIVDERKTNESYPARGSYGPIRRPGALPDLRNRQVSDYFGESLRASQSWRYMDNPEANPSQFMGPQREYPATQADITAEYPEEAYYREAEYLNPAEVEQLRNYRTGILQARRRVMGSVRALGDSNIFPLRGNAAVVMQRPRQPKARRDSFTRSIDEEKSTEPVTMRQPQLRRSPPMDFQGAYDEYFASYGPPPS